MGYFKSLALGTLDAAARCAVIYGIFYLAGVEIDHGMLAFALCVGLIISQHTQSEPNA